MHADYLEIRKNFLSHAAPKRSMAGMPSEIRTAGPSGMRKRANERIVNNNPQTARMARAYRSWLDVAKRYKSGKISYDQAKSLANGLIPIIQSPPNISENTRDTLVNNFKDEKELLYAFGITDDDWKLMNWFAGKMDNPNTNISRGSKAGMPSNIRHSALSHAMPKGYQGMPSEIRTAGPKGMRQKANERLINNTPEVARIAKAYRAALDVAKRYRSGKISYDQAKSLTNGLAPIMASYANVSQATIDNFGNNIKDENDALRAMGLTHEDFKLLGWFLEKMNDPNVNLSRGSKAGMPSNIRR